jgi:CRISPR-associated exonuclease Cas4
MFTEDDLLPISALQHLEFCPRRCALIHIEGMWAENALTAEGRVLHERVHTPSADNTDGVRTARSLRLCSRELGLFGVADVVEFHRLPENPPLPLGEGRGEGVVPVAAGTVESAVLHAGVTLPNAPGRWRPFPVEYKRGKRKPVQSYFVQLCAQALCLEEMLKTDVPAGALYHGQSRRRQPVDFDAQLRSATRDLIKRLHELIASRRTPPPKYEPKCNFCSLMPVCVPKLPPSRSANDYVAASLRDILGDSEPQEK